MKGSSLLAYRTILVLVMVIGLQYAAKHGAAYGKLVDHVVKAWQLHRAPYDANVAQILNSPVVLDAFGHHQAPGRRLKLKGKLFERIASSMGKDTLDGKPIKQILRPRLTDSPSNREWYSQGMIMATTATTTEIGPARRAADVLAGQEAVQDAGIIANYWKTKKKLLKRELVAIRKALKAAASRSQKITEEIVQLVIDKEDDRAEAAKEIKRARKRKKEAYEELKDAEREMRFILGMKAIEGVKQRKIMNQMEVAPSPGAMITRSEEAEASEAEAAETEEAEDTLDIDEIEDVKDTEVEHLQARTIADIVQKQKKKALQSRPREGSFAKFIEKQKQKVDD